MKEKVKEKQREDMFMFQLRCLLLIMGSTVRHSTQSFLLSAVVLNHWRAKIKVISKTNHFKAFL